VVRSCIFIAGVGSAFLQMMFLLVLMMEAPGWIEGNEERIPGKENEEIVRYISDALAVHHGFGIALIMLFFVSVVVLSLCSVNLKGSWQRLAFYFVLVLPVSSGFCVVSFPNSEYGWEHVLSTMLLFGSFAAVYIFILLTSKESYFKVDCCLVIITVVFVALFVAFFALEVGLVVEAGDPAQADKEQTKREYQTSAAVFEFLAVSMYVLLNAMAPWRVRDHVMDREQ